MKTPKFYYSVYSLSPCDDPAYPNSFDEEFIDHFPTLAMARNYCTFNKGYYVIRCEGKIEYRRGVEIK